MPPLEIIVVLALATYRLARIATVDTLTEEPRNALYHWAWTVDVDAPTEPIHKGGGWRTYVYELFSCPLCFGVWTAAAVWAAWRYGGDIGHAALIVFALAGLQSLLAINLERA